MKTHPDTIHCKGALHLCLVPHSGPRLYRLPWLRVEVPSTLDTQVRCWDGHLRHFRQIEFGTPVYIQSLEVNTIILVICLYYSAIVDFISIF